jgi:hypothetical protein
LSRQTSSCKQHIKSRSKQDSAFVETNNNNSIYIWNWHKHHNAPQVAGHGAPKRTASRWRRTRPLACASTRLGIWKEVTRCKTQTALCQLLTAAVIRLLFCCKMPMRIHGCEEPIWLITFQTCFVGIFLASLWALRAIGDSARRLWLWRPCFVSLPKMPNFCNFSRVLIVILLPKQAVLSSGFAITYNPSGPSGLSHRLCFGYYLGYSIYHYVYYA